jgi:hypothetical protein
MGIGQMRQHEHGSTRLEHDPEKSMPSGLTRGWEPVLEKIMLHKKLEWDGDSKNSHPA